MPSAWVGHVRNVVPHLEALEYSKGRPPAQCPAQHADTLCVKKGQETGRDGG